MSTLLRKSSTTEINSNSPLLALTQARLNDSQAWLDHCQIKERLGNFKSPERDQNYVPSRSLLFPTQNRLSDVKCLEEKRKSPERTKKASKLSPPSQSLLMTTKARQCDSESLTMKKLEKEKEEKLKLSPAYVTSKFVPSDHLLSTTKARLRDKEAIEEMKKQKQQQQQQSKRESSTSPNKKSCLSPVKVNDRLLQRTACQVNSQRAYEVEKQQRKFADDIWWEVRKPAKCSTLYKHDAIVSKFNVPTASYLQSIVKKLDDQLAEQQQQRQQVPADHTVKIISSDSHLLSTTKCTQSASWEQYQKHLYEAVLHAPNSSAEHSHVAGGNATASPHANNTLDLPAKHSYGQDYESVPSKLFAETVSTKHHRWIAHNDSDKQAAYSPERSPTHDKQVPPVELSEQLLKPTKAFLASTFQPPQPTAYDDREYLNNEREKQWQAFCRKESFLTLPFDRIHKITDKNSKPEDPKKMKERYTSMCSVYNDPKRSNSLLSMESYWKQLLQQVRQHQRQAYQPVVETANPSIEKTHSTATVEEHSRDLEFHRYYYQRECLQQAAKRISICSDVSDLTHMNDLEVEDDMDEDCHALMNCRDSITPNELAMTRQGSTATSSRPVSLSYDIVYVPSPRKQSTQANQDGLVTVPSSVKPQSVSAFFPANSSCHEIDDGNNDNMVHLPSETVHKLSSDQIAVGSMDEDDITVVAVVQDHAQYNEDEAEVYGDDVLPLIA
jgi:hypothetical protein